MLGTLISAGADLAGSIMSGNAQADLAKSQWKHQKKVLQNQIQWSAADAKAAGLHPLFALGGSAGGGGGGFIPGQAEGGSFGNPYLEGAVGDWLGRTGSSVKDYLAGEDQKKGAATVDALNAGLIEAQTLESQSRTQLNLAESQAVQSQARLASVQQMGNPAGAVLNAVAGSAGKVHKGILGEMRELPGQTRSEDAEGWAGDIGDFLVGLRNVGESVGQNWKDNVSASSGWTDGATRGLQLLMQDLWGRVQAPLGRRVR